MQRREFLAATATAAAGSMALAQAGSAVAAPDAAGEAEPALLADLPIIDAHHHMFVFPAAGDKPQRQYLLPDLLADIQASGHRVIATVLCEDYAMYRADGPVELRPVGETEFANGIAAMSASGIFGPCRVSSGIVAFADLRLGDKVAPVLEAHKRAAGGRLKGIRSGSAWDAYPVFGKPLDPARANMLEDTQFRRGMVQLQAMGLSFDAFCFHPQLGQVADLAGAFPGTTIILNHVGTPLGVGPYAGQRDDVMAQWRTSMKALAKHPNVMVKIGGMGMWMYGLPSAGRKPRSSSSALAEEWRPYVQTCIDDFGPDRCMFESNYPPDGETATYGALWNTFKRLTADHTPAERAALFNGTANRVYRLGITIPA